MPVFDSSACLPTAELRQLRSEQSTAFGTRGFVGGTSDPSGLTHLGAREYDPALGAFISVDPIIDFADPAQMHAYSYAHNTPLTKSDPDGLRPAPVAGTSDVEEFNWARDRGMRVGYTQRNGRYVWGYHPMKDTASQHRYRAYQANVKAYEAAKASRAAAARAKAQAIARAKAAKAKADAERRKKDGIWGNIMKGEFGAAWKNTKDSAVGEWVGDHWDDIKDGATIVGFGVCIVASAGACIVVSAGIAAAKFSGDWLITGNANYRALGKDLAWTAVGGGSAAAFGRAFGGAASWSQAYRASPIVRRESVRVVTPANSMRHATVHQAIRIDMGATYGNMSVNAGFNTAFCGAGNSSLGSYVGGC
ncbi:hypothetical protein DDQ41_07190 [Streptomyces spongiicola]|uniref:RHS repeat-associated core domain-containing protein n=1 Tax=Streptomyces spongiicola TaxID=1690221 RepID=A0ABM6V4C2_9ACTN|nr:RHS repeat-associated core domain-containing protein [Streptomyces spongiicola]AWK08741.1 hypothetical protein DDQ41_07190 [Streptomyces spongiicola]